MLHRVRAKNIWMFGENILTFINVIKKAMPTPGKINTIIVIK